MMAINLRAPFSSNLLFITFNMEKKILFIFIFIGYSFNMQSQIFNNRYIIDQSAVIFQRLVQTGDTIITMGVGATFYNPYPGKIMFTKFDHEGEVLSYDLVMGDSLTHYFPLSSSSQDRKVLIVGGAGGSFANQSGFYALYDLDNNLLVFPNSAKDYIEIQIREKNTSISKVEIYDMVGRVVDSRKYDMVNNNTLTFNVSHLGTGVYFLKVNDKYIRKVYFQ